MERNYNGGYYLIKTKPIVFGSDIGKVVMTCSRCINFSVFDSWCLSWMSDELDEKEKIELGLTDERIKEIQKWTDSRFYTDSNVFPDLKTATEFKDLFLNSVNGIEIFSLSFSETDTDLLISDFAEGNNTNRFNQNNGNFGLRKNLIKRTEEEQEINEELLGYDFIGVERDGSFHSFYCHNITSILVDKFSLKINLYGLFDKPENSTEIRVYLNDPETAVEPVPWYLVKVKRFKNAPQDMSEYGERKKQFDTLLESQQ